MLRIDYEARLKRAILAWDPADEDAPWSRMIRRLLLDQAEDATQDNAFRISIPWWSFLALRSQLLEVFSAYGLRPGHGLEVGIAAVELLRQSRNAAAAYDQAAGTTPIDAAALQARLTATGFARTLSPEQLRNVGIIATLPAAATFSVPGAGKTTEALAYFTCRAEAGDRLLVVCPKNAFPAWDEQVADCMPHLGVGFVRLRGGQDRIAQLLDADPRFMMITYQQLARVADLVGGHLAGRRCFVFLDESHRIKSGVNKQTARAALSISHLPAGKLILSGTPMPQALTDLLPQFAFLYPEVPAVEETVVDLIRPVYVRTNKAELGLPPVTRLVTPLPMSPVQAELYGLMRSEVAREASAALNTQSRQAFRKLGRSVARLLQFVSNPSLLASEIGFAHPDLLAQVLAEGEGPKLEHLLRRARSLARGGHKVLIWSSFVRNVEYINSRLADVGSVFIHGGVDAGDEDDDETREGKIRLFHDDPNIRVLVANPAAASEGISLHRVCHHALYLDRTFNAAHYLQSEDRIHRFGLAPDQSTTIEIIECAGSVDETVRESLRLKVDRMAQALEDSSLTIDPIPMDPSDEETGDGEDFVTGLSGDDVRALAGGFADAGA
jgi:SNF2 family DNA or RNA helicase